MPMPFQLMRLLECIQTVAIFPLSSRRTYQARDSVQSFHREFGLAYDAAKLYKIRVASASVNVGGNELALSNLDKMMYPEARFTKGQVIDYYTSIARYILPHLKNRPITLKRFPDGTDSQHFYEKNAPSFTPSWIKTFPVSRSSEESVINYILINDLPTLVWSANLANLEIHPFLAQAPHLERPTMVVFDLDPGTGANILNSCEVAFLVKEVLDGLNLKSFVKVSGSKGIHLHVPLNTKVSYESTQPFAKSIAQLLESQHPDLIVSQMPTAKRKGKVFVDWSQNSEHKSTVAVYSLRAKAGRPFVAMPVSWDELHRALKREDADALFFAPDAALERVKKIGDLFARSLTLKQKLPQPFLKLGSSGAAPDVSDRATALESYRQKRDFTKTPEPPPSMTRSSQQESRPLFVIQKHAARRLHYDLRLEMGGTLKSWAVPKGPPYELHEKRLAMATEDHPMEYAKFEGTIPKGEYGGGTVMVWDIGTYELLDGNYWKGKLHVFLNGKKLKGEWILVKGDDRDGKGNTWFLIKAGTQMERPSQKKENSSALSGRSLEKIAAAGDAVWHSNRNTSQRASRIPLSTDLDLKSLAETRVNFIQPMLAATATELPKASDDWIYEIKLDGYRCLAGRDSSGAKLWSRRGNLFTGDFPSIARACASLPDDTLIDGEIVALDGEGRVSFNLLQHRRSGASAIRFYAFDLLVYQGRSMVGVELSKRRKLLAGLISQASESIQLSESFEVAPTELLRVAKQLGLEGIVAKNKRSRYEPGKRSGAWIKYKANKGQEFVIGGYTQGNPFDAVVVGYYRDGKLIFASKVRNGFVPRLRRELASRLKPLETDSCPFANLPEGKRTPWALTKEEMKKCVWLRPALVAAIEFTEWTPDGHLRSATFAGLREDKKPEDVVRESV
jgi:bifunctional non-homologous end joining protein LigD